MQTKNAPTFTGNGNHSHVCLLLIIKIKTCTYQLCKRQSADTNVVIGRYRLSAVCNNRPVPIIGASLVSIHNLMKLQIVFSENLNAIATVNVLWPHR